MIEEVYEMKRIACDVLDVRQKLKQFSSRFGTEDKFGACWRASQIRTVSFLPFHLFGHI